MSKDKSQKKRKNNINKAELWKIIDADSENIREKTNNPIECYGSTNREYCDLCECILGYSDEGFLACTNTKCGIIYKDVLDHSPEWRYYGADDNQNSDPTRCGMPVNPLLEESSYGCKVICGGPMSYEMRKIRRYTEWQSMPYKEKAQYDDFQFIITMAQNAGIPKKIIDDALLYHKKISESETRFRGENKDGIMAASIYIACKINNNARSAQEIAEMFHLDPTSATKGCKNAVHIINTLEKDMDNSEKTNLCNTNPEAFIERYCSKLNINSDLTKLCQFIAIIIDKQQLMPENTPPSIAAGVVYFISHLCKLNVNKKDIKDVSGSSEVTINKCYKKLEKIIIEGNIIPSQIKKKYNLDSIL